MAFLMRMERAAPIARVSTSPPTQASCLSWLSYRLRCSLYRPRIDERVWPRPIATKGLRAEHRLDPSFAPGSFEKLHPLIRVAVTSGDGLIA